MFQRILIANRGEIALRVLRACQDLGIGTVCVYSEADRNASYLRYADESICIGPPPAAKSYLDISRIISAAEVSDVEAIHPGYGFLSENSHFAEVCASCNIEFIGPPPEAMRMLGNKARCRELAKKVGVPTVSGSDTVDSEEKAIAVAREVGYPVMIKAAAGGGGRGMRQAHNDVSLVSGLLAAAAEAGAAFGDSSVFIEKYVEKARHIEIQVIGDKHGNMIHLGERDCSIQRRHQKLIEESPSPVVTPELRARMGADAVKLAKAAGYWSAGTVEFLLDPGGKYYLIEMNTRIQVEHGVTELVTGVDLVREQIRVAAGEKLSVKQEDVRWNGVAIECRINAEDPAHGFRPSPGKITHFFPPGGPWVRWDSHVYTGYEIPSNYDSMVGKLMVHRPTRGEAIAAMRRALEEIVIEGVKTSVPLHIEIFGHTHFIRGNVDTTFVEGYFAKK
ncbi:MAG: acetyl-CoA carboxylase biotin carboxylase subunit [Candidatus Brocadiae bacterium]|nr:acetyl-CoA carboxylase biotin carboxylase subunit [Candidatus Brocadiia bacterium]